MRISFVGHASIFLEVKDITILTDPWWTGPCFGAQWWIHPTPFLEPLEGRNPQYIYISHGHHDHFHSGTLAHFDRNTKILVAKGFDIAPALRSMGFCVLELPDGEAVEIGSGVEAIIRPTMNDDSMMIVSDGQEVCVNLNDALHATPPWFREKFLAWMKQRYPVVDYVLCGYGTASHFPNCYRIPGKDYAKTAAVRQHHFNAVWASIIQEIQPKFAFPFAADVLLLEDDLIWTNEPVHNAERPVDLLTRGGVPSDTQAIDLAPGFVVEDGEIKTRIVRAPVQNQVLRERYKAQIEKANRYPVIPESEVIGILPLLEKNLEVCEEYLATFRGNYKVLLRFRNSERGITVSKIGRKLRAKIVDTQQGNGAAYDLVFTTRLSYLKRSLDSIHGNEIMFVGSGCLFDFPDIETVSRKVHNEVRQIVRFHDTCPAPRYGDSSFLMHQSKQFVKRVLGIKEEDLYDLERWTVFSRDAV